MSASPLIGARHGSKALVERFGISALSQLIAAGTEARSRLQRYFGRSEAVLAAICRASSLLSSLAAERCSGGRDLETGISWILCARKLFDTPVAG
jgi:hypothetical protein